MMDLTPTPDLLRKRHRLVQHRTRLYLSMATAVERTTGRRLGGNAIDRLGAADVDSFGLPADVALAMAAELRVLVCLRSEIAGLEKAIVAGLRPTPVYRGLLEVPGIGKVLGMTIALEIGDIGRFAHVGNYVSYCRCVEAKRVSNGKRKGAGNAKNGNRWLAWAYVEAAHCAVRYDDRARRYHQRKKAKTHAMVASKAVAHKLARACYHVMKNGTAFDPERCFG